MKHATHLASAPRRTPLVLLAALALAAGGCASSKRRVNTPVEDLPVELWAVGISNAPPEPGSTRLDQFADADPSALTDFRDTLAPYGVWAEDPVYGTVWVPDPAVVGAGFTPYATDGRWGLDGADNHVWLSEHDGTFGWVVFRYGRWTPTASRGWAWVPGRTYAPAWVSWRAGVPGEQRYVAWGPAPPTFIWRQGFAMRIETPTPPMVACATRALFSYDLESQLLPRERSTAIAAALFDFDARWSDGLARPRPFAADAVALPARGPSYATGHFPRALWPTERHSRAGTPNSRYATPAAMGRSTESSNLAAYTSPGATLKTYAAGGAQVHSRSRSMQSARLYVPTYGGGPATQASESSMPAMEDTAVAPTSSDMVQVVVPHTSISRSDARLTRPARPAHQSRPSSRARVRRPRAETRSCRAAASMSPPDSCWAFSRSSRVRSAGRRMPDSRSQRSSVA
jgi:hypothetical protein